MTIVASNDPQILSVEVTDDLLTAHLADGRTISVPLVWSWCLANATPEQRNHQRRDTPRRTRPATDLGEFGRILSATLTTIRPCIWVAGQQ